MSIGQIDPLQGRSQNGFRGTYGCIQSVRRQDCAVEACRAAAAGEEIIIAKAGKPMVKLVPVASKSERRKLGQNLMGLTYIAADFDAPAFTDKELDEWGF